MHQVPTSRRDERIVDPDQVCDALAVLADRPAVQRSAAVLGALGDPSRLSLLLVLHHAGDLCVSDLAFAVGMAAGSRIRPGVHLAHRWGGLSS